MRGREKEDAVSGQARPAAALVKEFEIATAPAYCAGRTPMPANHRAGRRDLPHACSAIGRRRAGREVAGRGPGNAQGQRPRGGRPARCPRTGLDGDDQRLGGQQETSKEVGGPAVVISRPTNSITPTCAIPTLDESPLNIFFLRGGWGAKEVEGELRPIIGRAHLVWAVAHREFEQAMDCSGVTPRI